MTETKIINWWNSLESKTRQNYINKYDPKLMYGTSLGMAKHIYKKIKP